MLDFIITTGVFGVVGIVLVLIGVLFLAKPDKEICFWGVRFHKKRIVLPLHLFRRYPKKIPEDWFVVYDIFKDADRKNLLFDSFYREAREVSKELKIRVAVDQMKKHGLINESFNHISLTSNGLSKLADYQ